jgi:hypothetical protein
VPRSLRWAAGGERTPDRVLTEDEGPSEGADATIVEYGTGAAGRSRSRRTDARGSASLTGTAAEVSIREASER